MEGLGFLYGAAAESRVDSGQHTLGDVGCGLKERIYFHLRFFFPQNLQLLLSHYEWGL